MKRLLKPQSLLAAFVIAIAGLCFYAKATTQCPTAAGEWQGLGNEPSVTWVLQEQWICCNGELHTNTLAMKGSSQWGAWSDAGRVWVWCEGTVDEAYEWHHCVVQHPVSHYYFATFGPGQCNTTTELVCQWHAYAICDGQFGGGTNRMDAWDYGYRVCQGGSYGRTNVACQFQWSPSCGVNCTNASLSSSASSWSGGTCTP